MYAVAGVSGRTGAATAAALLRQGQKVRVLVRQEAQGEPWLRRHAEVAVLDLADGAALAKALAGLAGAWLMLPPGMDADTFTARVVPAVKASGVKHLAFLSAAGAQHPAGTGPLVALHRAEKALKDAAPALTFLRAAPFVESWGAFFLDALETGELPCFGHAHTKYAWSCAHDVGEFAAKLLADPPKGHAPRIVDVAARENWSAEDVAAIAASLLGTPVKAVSIPVEQAKERLLAKGLPEAEATLQAEWWQALERGLLGFAHSHGVLRGTTSLHDALKPLA